MLKIVHPICCGMDVHKSFVVACIATTNERGVTTYKSKRFSTFTGDLRRCAAWLAENNCKDVCMESTGKYWIPLYNILERTCNIVLAHPKYVKAIRGKKTDKRDAKWIADIFKHDLVTGSFIPLADIRQLRDLVRYRWKLTSFTTGEKNRAQNCLTVSNFKLDDVFSDVFGKAAFAITTRILNNPAEKITDVSNFRTKGMKATDEQVLAAVDGAMCEEQAEKLRIIRSHMDKMCIRDSPLSCFFFISNYIHIIYPYTQSCIANFKLCTFPSSRIAASGSPIGLIKNAMTSRITPFCGE